MSMLLDCAFLHRLHHLRHHPEAGVPFFEIQLLRLAVFIHDQIDLVEVRLFSEFKQLLRRDGLATVGHGISPSLSVVIKHHFPPVHAGGGEEQQRGEER